MIKKIILTFISFILISPSSYAMQQARRLPDKDNFEKIDIEEGARGAFSSDGKYFIIGRHYDDLTIWDLSKTPARTAAIEFGQNWEAVVTDIEFSPKGRYAIIALHIDFAPDNFPALYLLDLSSDEITYEVLEYGCYDIAKIKFSPDEKFVAIIPQYGNPTPYLWDLTQEPKAKSKLEREIFRLEMSHDSKFLALALKDSSIDLIDLTADLEKSIKLTGHIDTIRSLVFKADSSFLYSLSIDKTLRRWNTSDPLANSEVVIELEENISPGISEFSPDGQYLICLNGKNVNLWNLVSDPVRLYILPINTHRYLQSAEFSNDGKYVVVNASDQICLFDLSGDQVTPIELHEERFPVNCVSFSPNSRYLLAGGESGALRLWDLSTQPISFERSTDKSRLGSSQWNAIFVIKFSGDSKHALAIGAQGSKLWKLE